MIPANKFDPFVVHVKLPVVGNYAHYILAEEEMTNFVLAVFPSIFVPVMVAFIIQL